MTKRAVIALALALMPLAPLAAQTPMPSDNAELAAIFEADQAVRRVVTGIDWEAASRQDAARRERARAMLEAGEIVTAQDFYHAAFLFQHGAEPDSYLLAHVLATRALSLGMGKAEWIAAATLDRFLQSIDRPQVFGTQYGWTEETGATMEPYDRDLLDDRLRSAAGVETFLQQAGKLERMRETIGEHAH